MPGSLSLVISTEGMPLLVRLRKRYSPADAFRGEVFNVFFSRQFTPVQRIKSGKTLLLLGGGHSHALLVKRIGMRPLFEAERTFLVSEETHTPYSGMLPGLIRGFYTFDQAHIDLRTLCQFAGVTFIRGRAKRIDFGQSLVNIEGRPVIPFDLLSINIGSTPEICTVPGADQFATPVKPVPQFLRQVEALATEIAHGQEVALTIVGGGAGGVELALNLKARFGRSISITLVHAAETLLENHNQKVQKLVFSLLQEREVTVFLNQRVSEVRASSLFTDQQRELSFTHCFWVTSAAPHPMIRESGLSVDKKGFLLVNQYLQSVSHSNVFGAGDVASFQETPRPKSGVFAVRSAKPLESNLRSFLKGQPLRKFSPQKEFLSLIGTGDRKAIASRGKSGLYSSFLWYLKDFIDKRFMRKFSHLSAMTPAQVVRRGNESEMRCRGCAGKIEASVLNRVLDEVAPAGGSYRDDAVEIELASPRRLFETTDIISAFIDDDYVFGKVAANHALSDLFAMGAELHHALLQLLVPRESSSIMHSRMKAILEGVSEIVSKAGGKIVGGHTAEAEQVFVGLTCTGVIERDVSVLRKGGARPGDLLILTKPLGNGVLFAGHMRLLAKGRWLDGAIAQMLQSNQRAGRILRESGATSCTDVTGFGLAGHLLEMCQASRCGAALTLSELPQLEGAEELGQRGVRSTLYEANCSVDAYFTHPLEHHPAFPILFDPQTSGGLLATIAPEQATACIEELQKVGYERACIIGEMNSENGRVFLTE